MYVYDVHNFLCRIFSVVLLYVGPAKMSKGKRKWGEKYLKSSKSSRIAGMCTPYSITL